MTLTRTVGDFTKDRIPCMPFDVYGVGNSLVDIQARITDQVVARLGFHKGIMTLVDETTQRRVLGELAGVPLSRSAGGSAANTVIALADFGGQDRKSVV